MDLCYCNIVNCCTIFPLKALKIKIAKALPRKRLSLFIVVHTITISVLSFVSRCSHFEM